MTLEEALDLLGSIQLLSVTKHRAEKLLAAVDAAVAAEREACAKMMDWQPIETAPKDGTVVLIFDGGDIVVARWWPNYHPEHSWRGTYGDGDAAWNPSHWMSLPEPPK